MKNTVLLPLMAAVLSLACALVAPTAPPAAPTLEATLPAPTATTEPTATVEPVTPTATQVPEAVRGEVARLHIESITTQIGARLAGTKSETRTAQYIEDVLRGHGYDTEVQPFSRMGWVGEDEIETMIDSANVVAIKAGALEETIVVGAHYDSSDEGLGADDNASGVGVLLEVAELLKDKPTRYTVHFVAFGAEEVGLLGSEAYVKSLNPQERADIVAMINLDSVIAGDATYAYSAEGAGAVVRDWALAWARQNGFDLQTISNVDLYEEGYGTSDFAAFEKAGIPFVYFESTNWTLGDKDGYTQVGTQYGDQGTIFHTRYDTLDYLDKTFAGRVDAHLELVTSAVEAILMQFEFPH